MPSRRELLAAATARLRDGGVATPEHDAAELLAHVLGTERSRLPLVEEVADADAARYDGLVRRRSAREPLQHLTGTAHFRHVSLAVGPGVFVPRPETELLAGWAIEQVQALVEARTAASAPPAADAHLGNRPATEPPVVVDLCTGSGAIALALADEAPHARVHAVEVDEAAHAWAERNLAGTTVTLHRGDLATALPELEGRVDVLVCNPPYVPLDAWESVAAEARDHDPHLALFSGPDGLDAIRALATRAAVLLRPGGVLGVEHADVQGESVQEVFTATGRWADVRDHEDLAGRPRYLTARLAEAPRVRG